MNNLQLNHDMLRVCFDEAMTSSDTLGLPDAWLLYRGMVRRRLRDVIDEAFERTLSVMGEATAKRVFSHWLKVSPPRTRFFREVPEAFGNYIQSPEGIAALGPGYTAYMADLMLYEMALWRIAYAPGLKPEGIVDLAFDKPVCLNPTVNLLRLHHAVHLVDTMGATTPTYLCVFRHLEDHQVRTLVLNETSWMLLQIWRDKLQLTLSETLKFYAETNEKSLDTAFLEGLAELLSNLVAQNVVMGSGSFE